MIEGPQELEYGYFLTLWLLYSYGTQANHASVNINAITLIHEPRSVVQHVPAYHWVEGRINPGYVGGGGAAAAKCQI